MKIVKGKLDNRYTYDGRFGYTYGLILGVDFRKYTLGVLDGYFLVLTVEQGDNLAKVQVDSLPISLGLKVTPKQFQEIQEQLPGKYVRLLSRELTFAYQITEISDEPLYLFAPWNKVWWWGDVSAVVGLVVEYAKTKTPRKVLVETTSGKLVKIAEDKLELLSWR